MHDGDKQNNLTWNVDNYSRIIGWDEVTIGGSVSKDKFLRNLAAKKDRLRQKLKGTGLLPAEINKKLIKFEEGELDRLSKMLQNFVLYQMRYIHKDSINAIEQSMGISLSTLTDAKDKFSKENFNDVFKKYESLEKSIGEALSRRNYSLNTDPTTIAVKQKANADGKMGVGIFASALKAYLGAYYGTLKNLAVETIDSLMNDVDDASKLNISSDASITEILEILAKNTDEIVDEETYHAAKLVEFSSTNAAESLGEATAKRLIEQLKEADVMPHQVGFVFDAESGDVEKSSSVANTKIGVDQIHSSRAQDAFVEMNAAFDKSTGTYKETFDFKRDILDKYYKDIQMDKKNNIDTSQAWSSLSELINASTDNAKELILGAIGADTYTSGAMVAGVSLGFDLFNVIQLLNDPSIKALKKELMASESLISGDVDSNGEEAISSNFKLELRRKITRSRLGFKSPEYQVYQLLLVADEARGLSTVFKINQEIPNDDKAVFKYLTQLRGAITPLHAKGKTEVMFEGVNVAQPDPVKFIEDSEYRDKIIAAFNESKVGLNTPYHITQNSNYFGQLQGLISSNKFMSVMSTISKMIQKDCLDANIVEGTLDERNYGVYNNYLYDRLIHAFYTEGNKSVTFKGISYDLTVPTGKSGVNGRTELFKDVPRIINSIQSSPEFRDNAFIKNLVTTSKSGAKMVRVRPAMTMSDSEKASIQLGAKQLSNDYPEMFDLLFNYSLLVDKSGLGSGSMSMFFPKESFDNFNEFLVDLDETGRGFQLLNDIPAEVRKALLGMKVVTTNVKVKATEDVDPEAMYGENQLDNQPRRDTSYETHSAKGISSDIPRTSIIKSKNNGLTYAYNPKVNAWVQISRSNKTFSNPYTDATINYDYDQARLVDMIGYEWGVEGYISEGEVGRILKYDGQLSGKALDRYNEKLEAKGKNPVTVGPPMYSVMDKNGRIFKVKAYALKKYNKDNGLYLNKYKMVPIQNSKPKRDVQKIVKVDGQYKNYSYMYVAGDSKYTDVEVFTTTAKVYNYNKSLPLTAGSIQSVIKEGINRVGNESYTESNMNTDLEAAFSDYATKVEEQLRLSHEQRFGSLSSNYKGMLDAALTDEVSEFIDSEIIKKYNILTSSNLSTVDAQVKRIKDTILIPNLISKISNKASTKDISDTDMEAYIKKLVGRNLRYQLDPTTRSITAAPIIETLRAMPAKRLYLMSKYGLKDMTSRLPEVDAIPFIDSFKTNSSKLTEYDLDIISEVPFLTNYALSKIMSEGIYQHEGMTAESGKTEADNIIKDSAQRDGFGIFISEDGNVTMDKNSSDNIKKIDGADGDIVPDAMSESDISNTKMQVVDVTVSKNADRDVTPELLERISKFLEGRFQNTTVKILSKQSIHDIFGPEYANKARGFVQNGVVYINSDLANMSTPLHEMGHIYLAHLKDTDLDLYLSLMNKVSGDPLMAEFRKGYPKLNETDLQEEVFVELLGRSSGEKLAERVNDTSILGKIMNFFKDLYSDMFGVNVNKLKDMTLDSSASDIIDAIGNKMLYGKKSILNDFPKKSRKKLELARGEVDYSKVEQMLRDMGYIAQICD